VTPTTLDQVAIPTRTPNSVANQPPANLHCPIATRTHANTATAGTRRIFATDAVSSGLPVHIVARLLGHKNLSTTQAYMAVFDEEIVRSYRAFLNTRRALRPEAEYREPTEQE
jgi:Phage integrase family